MPRLAAHAKMYRRYRIRYMNITYTSASGTATTGKIALGTCVGPLLKDVDSVDKILKLRPNLALPAWKSGSISIGSDVDTSRYMLAGDTTADGIAFTLYVQGDKGIGLIKVSYSVEFSQPRPF